MLCGSFCLNLRGRIQPWLRDYDRLQSFAVNLIYIQIGCALIGSLGALYNGVLLINLAIALFALVAIESSNQSLGRTYAFLLFCAILLDISWFILFTRDIWNISTKDYGSFFIFSVKLTLTMEIIGFSLRLSSSLLWIQIYRLGMDTTAPREADFDLRNSFLSPSNPAVVRQSSGSDEIVEGSIYDPAYYSSLFEDGQGNRYSYGGHNHGLGENEPTSAIEASQIKSSMVRSFQAVDEENASIKPQPV
ncbi:Transmembrane protein [Quillaja saponaria]|uniref:Transmembrane protein n=1 Tax=Quillaja saponaria TaxID=32244 RepID=A0AAD7VM15_QUISA|nr:Transmembrane protein [Quillaja saponaria]